jgi:hypothetical protein
MKYVGAVRIIAILVFIPAIQIQAKAPRIIDSLVSDTSHTAFGAEIIPLGDQNGDGFADVLVYEFYLGASLYYGGDPPSSLAAMRFHVENRISNVGDVNGDSFDDFAAALDGKKLFFYGGPTIDTIPDCRFGLDSIPAWGFTVRGMDIDQDGTDEIITWESRDEMSVQIFALTQPNDTIPIGKIWPSDFPLASYNFADALFGGDFNGDGRIDLAANFRADPSYNLKG